MLLSEFVTDIFASLPEFDDALCSDDDEEDCGPYNAPLGWGMADDLFACDTAQSSPYRDSIISVSSAGYRHSRSMNSLGLSLGSPASDTRRSIQAFKTPLRALASPPATVMEQAELEEGHETRDTSVPVHPLLSKSVRHEPYLASSYGSNTFSRPSISQSRPSFSKMTRASRSMMNLSSVDWNTRFTRRPTAATVFEDRNAEDRQAAKLVSRLDTVFQSSWTKVRGMLGRQQAAGN